ncbi:MBL fold metallo-hydrolase [candidate division KSB1 bacterium]
MKIGKFDLKIAWDGYFKLDGGAMFGVIPKPLWNKTDPADEHNRILLSLNPLLIRFDNENFLVDTGIGDRWDEKTISIYDIDRKNSLTQSLKEFSLKKEDITGVILTHLHFDHCGGSVEKDDNSVLKPAFPNAVYYIQKGEWDLAINPNERTRASYLTDNFLPLKEHGKVKFLDGNCEIIKEIRVEVTKGHTEYHQIVILESEGQTACYLGDLIPTSSHIKMPYIMGYDTDPMETLQFKKDLINRAVEGKWLIIFEHSPRIRAGYLEKTDKGVKLIPVDINAN